MYLLKSCDIWTTLEMWSFLKTMSFVSDESRASISARATAVWRPGPGQCRQNEVYEGVRERRVSCGERESVKEERP
jgi:hypothetical protein